MTRKKRKNKSLSLIALALVLLMTITAYILIRSLTNDDTVDTPDEESISLSDFSADDIIRIEYTFDETGFVLLRNGSTWQFEDDEKFPVDQTLVSNMTKALSTLQALRTVDGGELSDFGLDKPSCSLNVGLKDGTTQTYLIGAINSFNGSTYLLTEDTVYMFEDTISALFDADKEELIFIEDSFPSEITSSSITGITVKDYSGREVSFNADEAEELLTELKSTLKFKDYAAYGLTADELSAYGISDSGARFVISYKMSTSDDSSEDTNATVDATFTVYCGKTTSGEGVYALKDSSMLFSADISKLEALFAYTPELTDDTSEEV